jgi:hypothetical protein
MEAIRIDKYAMIKLEDSKEYGFKLIEGWESRDGSFKPNFCKRQFKKDGEEKNVPVSVKLGDKQTAIATLRMLLAELGGKDEPGPGRQEPPIPDDIPF